jgi:hypothetical protein
LRRIFSRVLGFEDEGSAIESDVHAKTHSNVRADA